MWPLPPWAPKVADLLSPAEASEQAMRFATRADDVARASMDRTRALLRSGEITPAEAVARLTRSDRRIHPEKWGPVGEVDDDRDRAEGAGRPSGNGA